MCCAACWVHAVFHAAALHAVLHQSQPRAFKTVVWCVVLYFLLLAVCRARLCSGLPLARRSPPGTRLAVPTSRWQRSRGNTLPWRTAAPRYKCCTAAAARGGCKKSGCWPCRSRPPPWRCSSLAAGLGQQERCDPVLLPRDWSRDLLLKECLPWPTSSLIHQCSPAPLPRHRSVAGR